MLLVTNSHITYIWFSPGLPRVPKRETDQQEHFAVSMYVIPKDLITAVRIYMLVIVRRISRSKPYAIAETRKRESGQQYLFLSGTSSHALYLHPLGVYANWQALSSQLKKYCYE